MIIRRKHTANYTTIGNVLFNDERLAADEVGILAFLLSRPNEWEVRRPALMRRWKIGRDGMKRVMTNWMRTGWCRAEKTRLANGTFHIIYEIRDEPGPELSDDDIRKALSLVSSEASDDESGDDDTGDQDGATGQPPTPQPGVAGHPPASRSSPIEDSKTTDSIRTESTNHARDYVDVKAKWPTEHVLSDVAAQSAFLALTDNVKEAAFRGVGLYLDDCRSQNRKICDLTTYLREKRWERFVAKGLASSQPAQFKVFSPNWQRWLAHKKANGQPTAFMEKYARDNPNGNWTEPSEWPPAKGRTETAPLATESDLDEFSKAG